MEAQYAPRSCHQLQPCQNKIRWSGICFSNILYRWKKRSWSLFLYVFIMQGIERVQGASETDENAENKKQKVDHGPTDENAENKKQKVDHGPTDENAENKKQKFDHGPTDTNYEHSVSILKNETAEFSENGQNSKAYLEPSEFISVIKNLKERVPVEKMKQILSENGLDVSGSDEAVAQRCADLMMYGPLEACPMCGGNLEFSGFNYRCPTGFISEWSKCSYTTRTARRKNGLWVNIPTTFNNEFLSELSRKQQDSNQRPIRESLPGDKPFSGLTIALSGRMSRPQHLWREEIEKNGGMVVTAITNGVDCVVVSEKERTKGNSAKVAQAKEKGIHVVRESWLNNSIDNQKVQPTETYEITTDLLASHEVPWTERTTDEEAAESLMTELKLNGKRGVYKDSGLRDNGGFILERDGLLYNCAFSVCDQAIGLNDYCVMQLIGVPKGPLYLYFKRSRVGDDTNTQERRDQRTNVEEAINEFRQLFEELTGNEFEQWEREKKFAKKRLKFYPIDIAEGVEVRCGGLVPRQLGITAAHTKLDPRVAEICKILFGQEAYRLAMMEMAINIPDLPMGNVTDLHLKRCEDVLLEFAQYLTNNLADSEVKHEAMCLDLSNKWFSLLHSTRPFIIHEIQQLAELAAPTVEAVRDISFASQVIGDMSGAASLDDLLADRYSKLDCSIIPMERGHDDSIMILKYLQKTYKPIKIKNEPFRVNVHNIYALQGSGPTYKEVVKLPNKVLLWCGTRTCNLVRHLKNGLLPAIVSAPAPGYMFGRGIYFSDAAAKAAQYGFHGLDKPQGFLILAVASLGEKVIEMSKCPEDTKELEEKGMGVKGLGRKTTNENEHFTWKDEIRVPCGSLIPSGHKDSPLAYNEYVVYNPKQVKMMFLVSVRFEKIQ